jgi:DNA polymerase-3 subunit epsilon
MEKLIDKAKKLLRQQEAKNGLPPFMVAQIKEIIAENSKLVPPSTLLEDVRYVVMDLETTGFNHARGDEIIAVGAVIVEGCEIKGDKSFHQLVYPCRQVPENVLKLTGIQREMLVGRLSFFGVLIEFLDFIGNSVIVGHNISFDLGFINPRLKKFCRSKIKNKTLDTIAMAEALHIPV